MLTKLPIEKTPDENTVNKYWWKFIEEGYNAGDEMKDRIKRIMELSV